MIEAGFLRREGNQMALDRGIDVGQTVPVIIAGDILAEGADDTAVAAAGDPVRMAEAFKLAVRSAELALKAGPPAPRNTASASSPMNAFDIFK